MAPLLAVGVVNLDSNSLNFRRLLFHSQSLSSCLSLPPSDPGLAVLLSPDPDLSWVWFQLSTCRDSQVNPLIHLQGNAPNLFLRGKCPLGGHV